MMHRHASSALSLMDSGGTLDLNPHQQFRDQDDGAQLCTGVGGVGVCQQWPANAPAHASICRCLPEAAAHAKAAVNESINRRSPCKT
mmetsp:Transcript_55655/g.129592  ORF Transcript_55655/g.129592 Transcript_55655/m.129592 type:complete len:87 (-) Transcript_55655:229-489(-)